MYWVYIKARRTIIKSATTDSHIVRKSLKKSIFYYLIYLPAISVTAKGNGAVSEIASLTCVRSQWQRDNVLRNDEVKSRSQWQRKMFISITHLLSLQGVPKRSLFFLFFSSRRFFVHFLSVQKAGRNLHNAGKTFFYPTPNTLNPSPDIQHPIPNT